jgi:flagellar basal-body rod modification protein FlgD
MTDIADIFGPTATTPNTAPLYASDMETSMGKEDFLTLLVAQLQNQDPMNPENPTEFTAQLAQFSSLEQLFTMNKSLEGLTAAQQQSDRFATMDLIDKTVSYTGSSFTFNTDPVTIGYQLDGTAASVTLSIQDEAGSTVATLHPTEMAQGNHFIEWDGMNNDGELVEPGKYKIVLQAASQGEDSSIAVSPLVQSIVTGVDFSGESGEAIIRTATGAEFGSDAILQIFTNQNNRSANSESSPDGYNPDGGGSSATEKFILDTAGKAISSSITKSAPTDEEQIAQDQLEHYLAA